MATTVPASVSTNVETSRPERDWVAKGGWYTLAIIVAVGMFGFVDRQVLILAAAPLARDLALSDGQLGMVQGLAFAVFTVVAVYPFAWAADRFDRRFVLGACIIIWSLGTAACGLAQSYAQLFLAAVAIAAGEAGISPIALSIVPDLFGGRKRALANSIYYFVSYLGVALGMALGGLAIGSLDAVHGDLPLALRQFESWRLAFFLVALPAPLFLVLIGFARLRRPAASATAASSAIPAAPFLPFLRAQWVPVAAIFAALGLYMVAFQGYLIWLPVASVRLFGATPAENGAGMGLATALGMIGGVILGAACMRRLLPKWGKISALRISWIVMAATTPCILAFPFITATWHGYVLLGVIMVAGTAVGSLFPNLLQDVAPGPLRARMVAVYTILAGLLAGVAPTVIGLVSDALSSERGLLIAMTLVSLPTWIAALVLMRMAEQPFARLATHVAAIDSNASQAADPRSAAGASGL
jgi:MFS family permease